MFRQEIEKLKEVCKDLERVNEETIQLMVVIGKLSKTLRAGDGLKDTIPVELSKAVLSLFD